VLGHHESMLTSPGLHLKIAGDRFQELDIFIELIDSANAVGEIGLDGSKRYASSYLKQKQVIASAVKRCHDVGGRTLSIHSRQVVPDVLTLLREFPDPVSRFFIGSPERFRSLKPPLRKAAGSALAQQLSILRLARHGPIDFCLVLK